MTLTLYVDGPRWRAHLRQTASDIPGLVPVAKGNGYGFGIHRLARRAAWLGVDMVAVGTYAEVGTVTRRFDGDVLVLEPWRPNRPETPYGDRIVHTISRPEDLAGLSRSRGADSPRVVVEGLTSMRRHGMAPDDLRAALAAAGGVRVVGLALHLPLDGNHGPEAARWAEEVDAHQIFVSHLNAANRQRVQAARPAATVRPRVGTSLWLGAPEALNPRATVLDVHPVRRGDRVGYRQRRIVRDGHLLVLSGGTAHGIGLEAPTAAATWRQRAVSTARGGLDAAGWSLSPYVVDGRKRWFVEPPHMQVSMVHLPGSATCPAVGEEVPLEVRYTATAFDRVVVS